MRFTSEVHETPAYEGKIMRRKSPLGGEGKEESARKAMEQPKAMKYKKISTSLICSAVAMILPEV